MPTAFGVLGPLVVRDASGAAVPLGGQKARELLAVLLLHRGQILFVDTLVGKLWGDEPSTGAATTLRTYVGQVRRILEGAGAAAALQNRSGGYCLEVDPDDLDAERFESSLRLGQLTLGRHRSVITRLQALVDEHPFRERFSAQLMLVLYRSGRQAEALAVSAATRLRLADELGLDPGPELRELETSMLRQHPRLDAGTGTDGDVIERWLGIATSADDAPDAAPRWVRPVDHATPLRSVPRSRGRGRPDRVAVRRRRDAVADLRGDVRRLALGTHRARRRGHPLDRRGVGRGAALPGPPRRHDAAGDAADVPRPRDRPATPGSPTPG